MRKVLPLVGIALATLVLVKAARPKLAEALDPQQAAISGVVFEDRNGNDRQDRGERGVRGVSVSDGVTTVVTDSAGRYALDRHTGAQRSSFEIGTWVASGPVISGNALLAGAWDGNLYAFAGR